jgi:hypothetical protein
MTRKQNLPGKKAFSMSFNLGKELCKTSDSFNNLARFVEKSQLGDLVKVSRVVDISVAYSKLAHLENVATDDRYHSFLTHEEASNLLTELPVGNVGMSVNKNTVQIFMRKGKVFDSILANMEGKWEIAKGHDKLCVLPIGDGRTELLIFESNE